MSQIVHGRVVRDAQQPGPHRRAALELARAGRDPRSCRLRDVVGLAAALQDANEGAHSAAELLKDANPW